MDVAESRAINNRQNAFLGNYAGTGYGNMIRNTNNMQGLNKFQSSALLNQMKNNGQQHYQTGLSNGLSTNLRQQNKLSQQGANQQKNQALLQLQQQNQRLQHIRMLQKQHQQEKLYEIKKNQLSNTYTANKEQNEQFSNLKSNNKNPKPSNTFRKADTQNIGTENNMYGLYDYDGDYYDLG